METTTAKEEIEIKKEEVNCGNKNPSDSSKNNQVRVVRTTKKIKLDESLQTNLPKDSKDEDNKKDEDTKIVRSLKRSCELWSLEDKNTFFKALNEYGKDFDALQNLFQSQGKKQGLLENVTKNKEQIRHFYYRTWLKISKHLTFSEDIKKTTQELYGLINYGELRRKLPRTIHEKALLKLNELVYWGSSQIRYKGKTIRMKTPICRALRKLNQLEDWQEEVKLPSRVTVELSPGDNTAWWKVQASSMNPRVRTLLPIQRRLSSLLIFLQQRWQPKFKTYANMEDILDDRMEILRGGLLRVTPTTGHKISLPAVNLGEYLTSSSVSLNSHEKRFGLKESVPHCKGINRKLLKRCKLDKKLSNRPDEQSCSVTDNNSDLDIPDLSLNVNEMDLDKSIVESIEPNRFPGRETVDRIKQGWNTEEANSITVGDLFLMFGRDSKITLEYWWDAYSRDSSNPSNNTLEDDNLSLVLQKLLSLAKHSYGTSKSYDNTSGSSETVISSRIPSTKESTFRRPLIPQAYNKISSPDAFKTQLDKFKTRFCKRGRTVRQKNLVIQRQLPIVANKIDDQVLPTNVLIKTNDDETNSNEKFLNNLEDGKATTSIITSATQILKEGEHQWLNSEVGDFSLSSFLGQLDSPLKNSRSQTGISMIGDNNRPSSDVVSQMQCLMGENSVDYMAKFANLASQIASSDEEVKNIV